MKSQRTENVAGDRSTRGPGAAGTPPKSRGLLSTLTFPFRALHDYGQRHLVMRFIVGVIVLMGLFYAVYLLKWKYDIVTPFLKWNLTKHAHATGFVLRLLGNDVTVIPPTGENGPIVRSPRFVMEIVRGCDALEPSALFLAAVLAFPASWRAKLVGAVLGVLCMELTNVVRLVTLFYVGVYWRSYFDMMHKEVWQAGFIVISVMYWALWALWATRPAVRQENPEAAAQPQA